MKKTKNSGNQKFVQLCEFPEDYFFDRIFDSAKVNAKSSEILTVLGLKKTTLFDPKVEVDGKKLKLVGIVNSEMDQEENVIASFQKTEKFAQKIASLVQKNSASDSETQIFVPENTCKDSAREIGTPPEIKSDGVFYYRNDAELEQAMAQEKVLRKQDLTIGDQVFPSHGKSAKQLFVNQVILEEVEMRLVFSHHNEKLELFAFPFESRKDKNRKPVKLSFSEKIIESKQHLTLLQHSLFEEKNDFAVLASISEKFSLKNGCRVPSKIKITEILDFGLDYEGKAKIWDR